MSVWKPALKSFSDMLEMDGITIEGDTVLSLLYGIHLDLILLGATTNMSFDAVCDFIRSDDFEMFGNAKRVD